MGGAADVRRPAPCGPQCGTRNGYKHHGCRCLAGYEAEAKWCRERRAGLKNGTWRPLVPAGRAVRHLHKLTGYGMTYDMISLQTFIRPNYLHCLARGERAKIRPATEEIICTTDFSMLAAGPDSWVPATGAHRRVQGLRYAGWTLSMMDELIGIPGFRSGNLLRSPRVTQASHVAVAALADRLRDVDPVAAGVRQKDSARAVAGALSSGWVPLDAWVQDIDDPRSEPYKAVVRRRVRQAKAGSRRLAIVEETAHLAWCGYGPHDIANRLGVEWASILVAHARAGVPVPGRLVA